MKTDTHLLPCTKRKTKWIKDLSIKLATLNLINLGNSFVLIGRGKVFLKREQITLQDQWDLRKLRFCMAKDTFDQTKQQPTECENILPIPYETEG